MRKWIWFLKLKILIASRVVLKNSSMEDDLFDIALDICKGLYSHILANNEACLLINSQMCMLLSERLLEAQDTLETVHHQLEMTHLLSQSTLMEKQTDLLSESALVEQQIVHGLLKELVHVLWKAENTVFKDCSAGAKLMESALRQGGDLKETFREILYDLQWLCSILRKQVGQHSQVLQLADCDRTLCETAFNTLLTAAKKDEEDLIDLLRDPQGDHFCRVWDCPTERPCMKSLATQLLIKLKFQSQFQAWPATQKKNYHEWLYESTVHNLSAWPSVVSVNIHNLKAGTLLGQGANGIVREAEWLKEPYAMKISRYGYQQIFKHEIAALSGLHHPHIMHLVCCADEGERCSYIMELMDMTLSKMLENSHLSLLRGVDVMLQIAEGINYLHSMDLVHRDLKTDNILVKCHHPRSEHSMPALWPEGPLWITKVSDFGTTKLKMESTAYANQTMPIGTTMFMAPEAYELEDGDMQPQRFHPKKTDVYSFGLICCCVLIREPTPFPPTELMNPSVRAFKARVQQGMRPHLPHYPDYLSGLIQQCWDGNPVNRPDFQTICTELRYIKGCLLTGLDYNLYLQPASARFPPNPIGGFIQVYKKGSITQEIDVNQLSNYKELWDMLALMFNLEGPDADYYWKVMYENNEKRVCLIWDDPWEVFVTTVSTIHLVSRM